VAFNTICGEPLWILYVQEQNQHSSEGEEETSSITQVLALMQPQEHEVYHRFIQTYNETVHSLTTFRNLHMEMVKVYIVAEQRKAAMATAKAKGERSLGDAAGGKGTGGTGIMSFLKPMRNRTREKVVKTA
jgi:indoleamine 2,3-dioxygenase